MRAVAVFANVLMLVTIASQAAEAKITGTRWLPDEADCWITQLNLTREFNLASASMRDPKGTYGLMNVENVEYWSLEGHHLLLLDPDKEPVAEGYYDADEGTLRLHFTSEDDASQGEEDIPVPILVPFSEYEPIESCVFRVGGSY